MSKIVMNSFLVILFGLNIFAAESALLSLSPEKVAQIKEKIKREGELTSFSELKPIVRFLEEKLESERMVNLATSNPQIEQIRQMVLTSFFHIDLKFNVQVNDYPYEIPFKEPFPYRPTMEAVAEALELIDIAEKVFGENMDMNRLIEQGHMNWFSPLTTEDSKLSKVSSSNESHSINPEKRVLKNPLLEYRRFLRRIKTEGENAGFYEFKPTVDRIETDLMSEVTLKFIEDKPVLKYLHETAIKKIRQIKLEIENDSLISKPFAVKYPYRATIQAIYKAIRFFDIVERIKYKEHPDSQVVEKTWAPGAEESKRLLEPLYHFDRYKYHSFDLIANSEVIFWPTTFNLGFQELIRVRSVPIGFVGVETKTIRVDRHYQTPIDFWYHDVNHVRRMMGYIFRLLKKRNARTEAEKMAVYQEVDQLIESLLERVKLSPKPQKPASFSSIEDERKFNETMNAWNNEMALRRLIRITLFEIVHESALAGDRQSLIEDLRRGPETPQPFEYLSLEKEGVGKGIENLEKLRTDSGNLSSGSRKLRTMKKDGPVNVVYMNDRALSLLSNVMNKIMHGFYDATNDPKSYVVPVEYRTPENLATAAEHMFKLLGQKAPPRKQLLDWILSRKGSPEKYLKYRGLIVPVAIKEVNTSANGTVVNANVLIEVIKANLKKDDADADPYKHALMKKIVSEGVVKGEEVVMVPLLAPQSEEEITKKVKALGKNVHSLFGYSALGYQDRLGLLTQIENDLKKLDPKKTIINIGVTGDGLGEAYKLAKSMGFETMGFVSTKFLENGGHYSKFVDHIFIVKDKLWGGYLPGTSQMTPTTSLYVKLSDTMAAYGGGEISKITMKEFARTGKPISYHAFEMDHNKAIEVAAKKRRPPPESFQSPVGSIWNDIKKAQCLKWYKL